MTWTVTATSVGSLTVTAQVTQLTVAANNTRP